MYTLALFSFFCFFIEVIRGTRNYTILQYLLSLLQFLWEVFCPNWPQNGFFSRFPAPLLCFLLDMLSRLHGLGQSLFLRNYKKSLSSLKFLIPQRHRLVLLHMKSQNL